MSIEQSIDKLTAALTTYTAVLEKVASGVTAQATATTTTKAAAPKKEAKKTEAPKKEAPAKTEGPSEDELKALTVSAIKEHDKAAEVKEILTGYKVKKATDLPEDKWREFMDKVQAVIDGGDDDSLV